jgi:hypothetical protein
MWRWVGEEGVAGRKKKTQAAAGPDTSLSSLLPSSILQAARDRALELTGPETKRRTSQLDLEAEAAVRYFSCCCCF